MALLSLPYASRCLFGVYLNLTSTLAMPHSHKLTWLNTDVGMQLARHTVTDH